MKKENKKPIKKYRAGSLTATIWKAKDEKSKAHLVVFEKSYKDKEGKWQNTNHFSMSDLPTIAKLAETSFDYLIQKGQ